MESYEKRMYKDEPSILDMWQYSTTAHLHIEDGGTEEEIRALLERYDEHLLSTALVHLCSKTSYEKIGPMSRAVYDRVTTIARIMVELGADPTYKFYEKTAEEYNTDQFGEIGPLGAFVRKMRFMFTSDRRGDPNIYYRNAERVRKSGFPAFKTPRLARGPDYASGMYTPTAGYYATESYTPDFDSMQ